MTRARRLHHLETQWRPARVAAMLARVRQCAGSDRHAIMLQEFAGIDRATARACLRQLTDEELETMIGPEAHAYFNALSREETEALARGNPAALAALQQVLRASS